jgi:hypothetical protein
MASPVQFGDIIRAIEICEWLVQYCFNPINNANAKYLEFKQDVIDLHKRLVHLRSELENALHSIADPARYNELINEIDGLIGDFRSTLEECKDLLRKFIKFDNRSSKVNAVENLFWHCSTQQKVENLQTRLKEHTYKIFLVIEPIQLGIITSIYDLVHRNQQTLELILRRLGPSVDVRIPQIPQSINEKFELLFKRDCLLPFDNLQDPPLKESVDILCTHFRKCTFRSTSLGVGSTLEEKLSLLKAHWLHQILSKSLLRQPPQQYPLLRQIVLQIGQGVERQYEYRQFTIWNEDEFASLEEEAFAIWPIKEVVRLPDLARPSELEKTLVDVELLSEYTDQNERFLIFQAKDTILRMVLLRTPHDGPGFTDRIQTIIDLQSDSFVPLYSVAGKRGVPRQWTVTIAESKGRQIAYQFTSRSDVYKVQRAFTGYNVTACAENIFCAVTYKGLIRDHQFVGLGEVQIWCPPGFTFKRDLSSSQVPSQTASQVTDITRNTRGTITSILSQRHPDVVSVITTETGNETMLVELPSPPLLVGLLKDNDGYYIWQTERK